MPELVKRPRYQVGDKVQIKFGARLVGTVMEARGTYSESGHVTYTLHVPMDAEPLFMPVREDDIEKIEQARQDD